MITKYLCGIDWEHEFKEGIADLYDSVEDLKHDKSCWKQCGIVEVHFNEQNEPIQIKWIAKQDLNWGRKV